ncbi:MAG: nitroreductase [Pseudomonadota bacterium]
MSSNLRADADNASTESAIKPGAVLELLRGRRTIHDFREDSPPQSLVLNAIEAARWAPNHHATEPWHFYLLGPETIEAVSGLNRDLVAAKRGPDAGQEKYERWRKIPGWVVVTSDLSPDNEIRQQEDYASCCCAIHNFSLYLWSEGIGVKWTTGPVTRDPQFYDLIWVDPAIENVVGLMWYGYALEEPMINRGDVESYLVTLP